MQQRDYNGMPSILHREETTTILQILAATEKSLSNTTGADRWNAGAQMVMLLRQLDVFLTNVVAHYADRKLRMESQLAESAEQWCAINFMPYDGS